METESCLDSSINSTMRDYLAKFFTAVQEGNVAYSSFLNKFSTFNDTIRMHHSKLRGETLSAVNSFTSVIRIVATDLLELRTVTEKTINESSIEISRILNRKMNDLTITDDQDLKSLKGQPPYIKPSYQWLLCNLHNPYPSKEVKKDISRQTKCSLKDIDAWFIDVRKRIGWNQLRKSRFSNKQEQIVAAATHILKPTPSSFSDDPTATLLSQMDPRDQYRAEFIKMAHTARSLYSDKYPDLLSSLSWTHFVNHVTPEANSNDSPLSNRRLSSNQTLVDSRYPYPTPEPSPRSNFVDDVSTPSPSSPPQKSLKRRRSIDSVDVDHIFIHSPKRIRSDTLELTDMLSPTSLPSPSRTADYSADETFDSDNLSNSAAEGSVESDLRTLKRKRRLSDAEEIKSAKQPHLSRTLENIPFETPISEVSRMKRKRRLSEGEDLRISKRPHNALAHPRLQTVSDPFPVTHSGLSIPFTSSSQQVGGDEERVQDAPFSALLIQPLQDSDVEQIVPSTCPDPDPTGYLSYLINEEHAVSSYLPENAESMSAFISPMYHDTLPDLPSNILVTTADFPDLNDFSLPQGLPPTQLTSMNDDLSHWLTCIQSDNFYDPPSCLGYALPTAFDNHEVYSESLDVKRAKLQALKQQVAQLEGQLAGQ